MTASKRWQGYATIVHGARRLGSAGGPVHGGRDRRRDDA